MKVEIDFSKSLQENANSYYGLSKKSRRKLAGLARGVEEVRKKISSASKATQEKALVKKRERLWFEKYHWCFTGDGLLIVGGKDARSNEEIVKKVMEKGDVYFHADVHGAPHVVLKTGEVLPNEGSLREAAVFAAVFSSAWRDGLASVDVYSAEPEQVSKSAPSGEAIGSGAFMVRGERRWFRKTPLEFAVGYAQSDKGVDVFSGPKSAVKKRADFFVPLSFGDLSKSDAAKKILSVFRQRLGTAPSTVDDVSKLLPSSNIRVDA